MREVIARMKISYDEVNESCVCVCVCVGMPVWVKVCTRPLSPRTTIRTIRHMPPPDRATLNVFALANDLISPLTIASFPSLPRNLNGGQYIRRGEIIWRCI